MPVESDTFVYLALQKTGSTFVHATLTDLFGARVVRSKHGRLLDDERSKFVFGSVRNPWDLYVSLWSFGCQGEGRMRRTATQRNVAAARRELPRPGPLVRAATKPVDRWRAHYAPPHTPEKFRRWLVDVHTPRRAAQFDPAFAATTMRRVAGFATYRYCFLYADDVTAVLGCADGSELAAAVSANFLPRAMIRFEHLADDLIAALREGGTVVDAPLEAEVRTRATRPVNDSDHRPYWEYYDDATEDLVRRRDAVIVERHGYAFGA